MVVMPLFSQSDLAQAPPPLPLLQPHVQYADWKHVRCGGLTTMEIRTQLRRADLPPDATPRQVRQAHLDAALDAIDAVEAAGWRHSQAPEIDMGGDMVRDPDDPRERIVCTRATLRLWLLEPSASGGASW